MAPENSSSRSQKPFALSAKRFQIVTGSVQAILLGFLVAILGTVMHQTKIAGAPYGLGLALGLTLWASLALRAKPKKFPVWVFAITLAALLTLFGQKADDVMIPASELGYAWAYGAIAIAVVVAAFPRLSKTTWAKQV